MTHWVWQTCPTFVVPHGIEGSLIPIKAAHGGGQKSMLEGPHRREEGTLLRHQQALYPVFA